MAFCPHLNQLLQPLQHKALIVPKAEELLHYQTMQ